MARNDMAVLVAIAIFVVGIAATVAAGNYGTAILASASALGMGGILRRAW